MAIVFIWRLGLHRNSRKKTLLYIHTGFQVIWVKIQTFLTEYQSIQFIKTKGNLKKTWAYSVEKCNGLGGVFYNCLGCNLII